MTDSVRVIWEYLTVPDTALYALVGTRIWSPESPASFKNTQAAIVFELLDEERRALPNNGVLVGFRCYGGKRQDLKDFSHDDARALYRALYDRLGTADGTATTTGKILVCTLESGAQTYGEDETEWPVTECQFRFTIE